MLIRPLAPGTGQQQAALRIAGARLVARPEWSLRGFADRLGRRAHRLDELQAEGLSVRDCVDRSYRRLLASPLAGRTRAARVFQLLGLLDHDEFDLTDVARPVGTDPRGAAGALDELVDARLVEPVTETTFRMDEPDPPLRGRTGPSERGVAAPAGLCPARPDRGPVAARPTVTSIITPARGVTW
ncbi:hypothetical protein ACH44C_33305 [Streptomyces purpureus]|uniref:hypothetical protein n=1 Tax=Streptomyces purpureus TaxID=1951 RepID=UPI003790BC83